MTPCRSCRASFTDTGHNGTRDRDDVLMTASAQTASKPLSGVRVLELGGIGPGPFAGMMLADLGADVIRIDRPGAAAAPSSAWHRVLLRGRRSLALDLKAPQAAPIVLSLADSCDGLIEGFRPGVAERLGIGPDAALARNPRLVYGRMTGWGQTGQLAQEVGHDINYLAVAGALHPLVGVDGSPSPPLNMLGDFGGGGMLLTVGVLAGILAARRTGVGTVVDAAIVDGTALLTGMLQSMLASGDWSGGRGGNVFDGGAPFYRTYATSDGRWIAVGALEPPFYAAFVAGLGLSEPLPGLGQFDQAAWPQASSMIARRVGQQTQSQWLATFAGSDACVSPVLDPGEVMSANDGVGARSYTSRGAVVEPNPAPRFDGEVPRLPPAWLGAGGHTREILGELGMTPEDIDRLREGGVISEHPG